ncbi:hypothetical protein B0J14DRAFT_666990 [Halenospora varia]|nr:hypothetical protein B0J14DRAFT_666990 [Halenospora varia]
MGIGAQRRGPQQPSASQSSGSTASYSAPPPPRNDPVLVFPVAGANGSLPPSYSASEGLALMPNVLLNPTHDHDLNYFHTVIAGDTPTYPPTSYILVMNVFRTTQKHLFPLDERIALGSNLNQPFYSLQSSPSVTSVDEFNKLMISRRDPARAFWSQACVSEIKPRLKLLAAGVMVISDLTITRKPGAMSERYQMTWEKARDTYTVWVNTVQGTMPFIDITLDKWESLDDVPGAEGGVIRAKLRSMQATAPHLDLAVLDATKPSLQLISTSPDGHRIMDLLVGSLMTVGIVHTRMAKLGRAAMAGPKRPDIQVNVSVVKERHFHFY